MLGRGNRKESATAAHLMCTSSRGREGGGGNGWGSPRGGEGKGARGGEGGACLAIEEVRAGVGFQVGASGGVDGGGGALSLVPVEEHVVQHVVDAAPLGEEGVPLQPASDDARMYAVHLHLGVHQSAGHVPSSQKHCVESSKFWGAGVVLPLSALPLPFSSPPFPLAFSFLSKHSPPFPLPSLPFRLPSPPFPSLSLLLPSFCLILSSHFFLLPNPFLISPFFLLTSLFPFLPSPKPFPYFSLPFPYFSLNLPCSSSVL